jgi:uncharacterized protein YifE (UPF0438 family)
MVGEEKMTVSSLTSIEANYLPPHSSHRRQNRTRASKVWFKNTARWVHEHKRKHAMTNVRSEIRLASAYTIDIH